MYSKLKQVELPDVTLGSRSEFQINSKYVWLKVDAKSQPVGESVYETNIEVNGRDVWFIRFVCR